MALPHSSHPHGFHVRLGYNGAVGLGQVLEGCQLLILKVYLYRAPVHCFGTVHEGCV